MSFEIDGFKIDGDDLMFSVELTITIDEAYEIMEWKEPDAYLYCSKLDTLHIARINEKCPLTLPPDLEYYLSYGE